MSRYTRYQAAIVRGSQLLLIMHRQHQDGRQYWLLPGGGIEAPESEEDCVRREALEETGLAVRVERVLMVEPIVSSIGYQEYKTYLCTPEAGEAAPGYEPEADAQAKYAIVKVGWFDLADPQSWDAELTQDRISYPLVMEIRRRLGYPESTD